MGFFNIFSIFHNPLPTEDGGVDNTIDMYPNTPTFTDDDICSSPIIDDGTSSIGTELFGSDTMFDDSSSDSFMDSSSSFGSDPFGSDW